MERAQAVGLGAEFDARKDVLRVAGLRIQGGGGSEFAAIAQIDQRNDQRGCADVDGSAVERRSSVAIFRCDNFAPSDHRRVPGDFVVGFGDPRIDGDGDGLAFAENLQSLVFPVRHLDAQVAVDEGLAGERPAGGAIGLGEFRMIGFPGVGAGGSIEPDAAFAANAGAVAWQIEGDAGALDRREKRPALGNLHNPVLVGEMNERHGGQLLRTVLVIARIASRCVEVLRPQAGEMMSMPLSTSRRVMVRTFSVSTNSSA